MQRLSARNPRRPPKHSRLRSAVALIGAAGLGVLQGCTTGTPPSVVAADGVLCDLTRRLAASDLPVVCLLRPDDDPHQFQLSPQQGAAVRQSRLLLINGYDLTPSLADVPKAVAVAELAVPGSPALASGRDPHVWHDPAQAAAMLQLVGQRLQALAPARAAAIQQRQQAMLQALGGLDRWNRQQFGTLPPGPGSRTLASGHRAFASLSRAYGLRELAVVDEHSASDSLRPQTLAEAVQHLQQDRVPALFSETWPPSRALSRISTLSGVKLAPQPLRADGLAPASATGGRDGDLISTLTANTCLIVDQLGGRCDRSGQQQLIQQWQAIR